MVGRGYVSDRDEAFRDYLYDDGPAYVSRYTPSLEEALGLVVGAGGVSVIAHPWGRGTKDVLTPELLRDLAQQGLDGLEVDHVDHDEPDRTRLADLSETLGLLTTGGSDYHGRGKTRNPLGVHTTTAENYELLCSTIIERGGQV
jgi:predicted metal-dependent phosphoesterase TrpH